MADDCDSVLNTHIKKVSDLKKATINMEFGGFGEFLKTPDEILECIFGYSENDRILKILSGDDENEIIEKLQSLKYLEKLTKESLESLVDFWKNCNEAPDMCEVTQELQPDGMIELTISW